MLQKPSKHVPPPASVLSRLQSRAVFEYHRLTLAWRAAREGRGRAVAMNRDGDLVRLHDGVRSICVPHVRRAHDFPNGINARLDAVADKYIGDAGYLPRESDVIVDIGAGIGEFTLWCADSGAKVIAFEPDPLAFACLTRNTAALPLVQLHPVALWKERGSLRLHSSTDTTESSLIEDGKALRTADVEAWPLDQLPFMVKPPVIDFMKIDGEGVEPEILAGGARTLRRTRVLAMNVGATDRRPNLKARVEMHLETHGFRPLPHQQKDTILALNTAMVGPVSSRVFGRRSS